MGTIAKMSLVAAMAAAAMVGCSSNAAEVPVAEGPRGDAENMIRGEMASEIGLGPLTAVCEEPPPYAVGTTWACTASTEDGQVITVQGSVNAEGHVEMVTTNLISAPAMLHFEADAAANLNNETGSSLPAESIDCGEAPLVVGADMVVPCLLTIPSSGVVYDLTMRITDIDARHFALQVAEEPRQG